MRRRGRRLRRWLGRIAVAGLLAAVLMLLLLARDVRDEIRNLAKASSANAQWSLSQPETELLSLILAAQGVRLGETPVEEFRRRYDIFYSRIRLMEVMPFYPEDLELPEIRGGLEAAQKFLLRTEAAFDREDAALAEQAPAVLAAAQTLRPALRELTLRSLQQRILRGDAQREALRITLVRLISSSAALLLALLILVVALSHMVRRGQLQNMRVRSAHARVRAIITASQDAILVIDGIGRIIDANDAALALFGLPAAELEDLPVTRFLAPAGGSNAPALPKAGARLVRVTGKRGDGSSFPAECSLTEIAGDAGPMRICFLRDISDRLNAERHLVETRDRALAGEKAKDELLAVMSHEMRTPLNGILGTLDLIEEDLPQEVRRDYDRIIRQSAEQLLRHVNDVLEIARMNALRMELRQEVFDACALLRDLADAQKGVAARNGNRVDLDLRDDSLAAVRGDGNRLHQILLNLVSNAIKFTRDGRILLRASRRPDGQAVFEVSDSGIGIAPQDMDRIFDEFVTLDTQYNRTSQGTGLGLAISRRLAGLMGGCLEAESRPGEGSLFRLTLPLPPADPLPPKALRREPLHRIRPLSVLVVEDNEINRFVARTMLQSDGHRVREAETGQEALRCAAAEPFDLILMDISMPGLDGVETTRRIRAECAMNLQTPVVALTAHARPEDLRRFAAGGIARSLTKPLRRAALRDLLRDYGPRQTEPSPEPPPLPGLSENIAPLLDPGPLEDMSATLPPGVLHSLRSRMTAEMSAGLPPLCTAEPDQSAADRAMLAHRLAGSAAIFGLTALHAALAEAETLLLSADPGAAPAPLPAEMRKGLEDLWRQSEQLLRRATEAAEEKAGS